MSTIAELLVKIGADSSGLRKELQASQRQLKRAFGSEALGASQAAAGALTAITAAMVGVGVESVYLSGKLRMTEKAFETLTGSVATAKNLIGELKDLDDKSAFDFDTYAKGAQKLLALGVAGDQVIPTLTAIGDASAALGQGQEGIDRIVLALSQMTAKGKVSAQEMNQLAENNVQGWRYLSQATGKSVAEVQKMAEKGMLNGSAAVQVIIAGMEKDYHGAMDKMANETPIVWNTITSNIEQILAGVGPTIDKTFGIGETLQKVRDYLVDFKKELDSVKDSAGGVRAVIDKMIPEGTQTAIIAIAGAITGAAVPSLGLLGVTAAKTLLQLSPYIIAGAAVAAAIWLLWKPISTVVNYLGQFEIVCVAAKAALAALSIAVGLLGIQAIIPSILTGATALAGFATAAWAAIAPLLPFIGIAAGVAAIAYVIMKAWKPLGDLFIGVWDLAKSYTKSAWASIQVFVMTGVTKVLRAIQPIAKVFGGTVEKSVSGFLDHAEESLENAKKAAADAQAQGKSATQAIARAWHDTGQAVASSFQSTQKVVQDTTAMAQKQVTKTNATVKSAGANTPPLVTAASTGKELEKIEDKAKELHLSISRELAQISNDDEEELKIWYQKQKDALEKVGNAYGTYAEDKANLDKIYAAKSKKIIEEQKERLLSLSRAAQDIVVNTKVESGGLDLSGTSKQIYDLYADLGNTYTNINRKYQDLQNDFAKATDKGKKEMVKAWTDAGLQFELTESGMVTFVQQAEAEKTIAREKSEQEYIKLVNERKERILGLERSAQDLADAFQSEKGGLGLSDGDKEFYDLKQSADQSIKDISRKYEDMQNGFASANDESRMEMIRSWAQAGLAFRITELGMVNFTEQAEAEKQLIREKYALDYQKLLKEQKRSAQDELSDLTVDFNGIGLTGVDKSLYDLTTNFNKSVTDMSRKYEDLQTEFAGSTADTKQKLIADWRAAGLAFTVTEQGTVDFTEQANQHKLKLAQEYNDNVKKLHYDLTKWQEQLDLARTDGDLAAYRNLLNDKQAANSKYLAAEQAFADGYKDIWDDAYTSVQDSALRGMTTAMDAFDSSLGSALGDWVNGADSAGDAWSAFRNDFLSALGDMVAKMVSAQVTLWAVNAAVGAIKKLFNIDLGSSLANTAKNEATTTAAVVAGITAQTVAATAAMGVVTGASSAMAATVAAAWAPAATMVSLATMGSNAAAAMAGITATSALSVSLAAVPKLANGGIATGPTLAEIGEGRYKEAVLPLNKRAFEKAGLTGGGDGQPIINNYLNLAALDGKSVERWLNNSGGKKITKFFKGQASSFKMVGVKL